MSDTQSRRTDDEPTARAARRMVELQSEYSRRAKDRQRKELIGDATAAKLSGVPDSFLPPGAKGRGVSMPDQVNARRREAQASGTAPDLTRPQLAAAVAPTRPAPAQSSVPNFAAPAPGNGYDRRMAGAFAASPPQVQIGTGEAGRAVAGQNAHRAGMIARGTQQPGGLRSSTPEEIASVQADQQIAASAGKGGEVATPFGTVSSRTAKPGESITPGVELKDDAGAAFGIARAPAQPEPTWMDQLAAKYPGLGDASHEHNQRFVAHFNSLQPEDRTPENAMKFADQMFGGLNKKAPASGRSASTPEAIANQEANDPNAPLLTPGAQKVVVVASNPIRAGVGAAMDAVTPIAKRALGTVFSPAAMKQTVNPMLGGVKRGITAGGLIPDFSQLQSPAAPTPAPALRTPTQTVPVTPAVPDFTQPTEEEKRKRRTTSASVG